MGPRGTDPLGLLLPGAAAHGALPAAGPSTDTAQLATLAISPKSVRFRPVLASFR
jgi:hypothetical protein